jgi:hypothetical protein
MQHWLIWMARFAGAAGIAVIALAVLARLSGAYWLGGFQVGTLLQAGMAATLVACLGYVAALAERATRQ